MRTLYIALLLLFASANTSAQTLTKFEYYFDTESGIGNGTAVTANANTGELSQTLSIPLTGLSEGFHKVVVRAKDDNNVWSMYSIANFYISDFGEVRTVPNLAAAEYFFGVDPGVGNGTALAVPANTGDVNTTFAIPLANLPAGFHTITLRAKDTDGTWGLHSTANFYISDFSPSVAPKDIVSLEYWFDTDPGIGNATAITLSPSQLVNQVIPIPLNELSVGFHKIGIRVKNEDGTWSFYDQKLFYINEEYIVSPLSEAEFLFDAEFGFGTGTSAVLTPTGNPDEFTVEIPTDLINCGVHDLSLSVKNSEGKYSLYKIAGNIDVYDDLPPTIVAQDITVQLDNSGTASITVEDVDNGTYDDCQLASLVLDITEFSCANLGENTVTLTATDAEGKVSTGTAIVTVEDIIAPSVFVQNISVDLDATGTATISAEDIDNGTFDNCTIASISIDIDTFSCSNIGANTVNFTAEDQSGNSTTVSFTVTVTDPLGACIQVPVAVCQPLAINSNNNCQANATPQAFDGGSYDPNGLPLTYTVDPVGPYNVGITNVTLTVSNGTDSDSCTTTITVVDNTPPVANCVAPFTVQLDANGQASISVAEIDNGSSDNCGIASTSINVTDFSCGNIGENTVTLTVTDISGHVSTCSTVVTVFDPFGACNEAPTAVCQVVTVSTDANCEGSAIAQDFDGGSTDPLGNPLTFTVNPMGPYPLGTTQVTLTVSNGTSSDSCTTTITVIDNTAPVASCAAPFTVQLDTNGNASISVSDIDNGSSDNCAIASMAIDKDTFDCSDRGENTVTLTVTDSSGNVSTCTTVVNVEDSLSPIANCAAPFTLQLDANGNASITVSEIDNGSSDNCGISSMAIDKDTFDCSDIGENTVTLTVTDSSGNVSTCTTVVTVEDSLSPIANCAAPFTLQLDANGSASITVWDIDNGSSDNCGIASMAIDKDTFDCSDIGENTITLTVTDSSGNVSTCTTVVTVEDSLSPIANCAAPFTLQLDANGSASITVSDIDNGSSDNCGISSMAIDKDTFDCSDIGENTVTLTVTDSSGNVSTCTTVVTVEDSLSPIANCAAPFTLQLDANGSASITVWDIDNGSSDNCGIASMAIDKDTFDCSDIGENTITLTVTDSSGNVSTCTTVVTVEDTLAPIVTAQDITVQLDANGNAYISPLDIDNGSSDNCGIASWAIDRDTFSCSDIGAVTVTLTVTDIHGNPNSATATVTVADPLNACGIVVPEDNFITTWKTSAANETITIPTYPGESYNYNVDWGDGNSNSGYYGNASHIYATAGTYTVSISGDFPRIYFNNSGDRLKIQSIEQWGNIQWSSMNSAFMGAENLVSHATDMPDLSMVSDMYGMFAFARKFNGDAQFGNWNVGNVTDMKGMFAGASVFNYPIGSWNVGNVTTMESMFFGATIFNQPLGNWNVSSVTTMRSMFQTAYGFNQSLNNWNVGNVTDMYGMFAYARKFNGEIGNWNVGNVTNMTGMFGGGSVFNKPIGNWNVGNVTSMEQMFHGATVFNQDLGTWNVGSVTSMRNMFNAAMRFNQNIGSWNVGNVTDMYFMFFHANRFDQDLGGWEVSNVSNMTNMFVNVTLSTDNYDSLLNGWSALSLKHNVKFHGGKSKYCSGEVARQHMITTFHWTITDGGKDCGVYNARLDVGTSAPLFGVALYPNPMKDKLNLDNPKNVQLESISIFDLTGRLVQKVELNGMTTGTVIDVSRLSSATYMAIIAGEGGNKTELLIKE